MKDSKKKSISEVLTNMAISFPIHFISNFVILPAYAPDMAVIGYDFFGFAWINMQLGFYFTLVSFTRQYLFRRLFNHYGPKETTLTLLNRLYRRIK